MTMTFEAIANDWPCPWHVGSGYEQCTPGIYIAAANGSIVLTCMAADQEDLPLTKELAEYIVFKVNTAKRIISASEERDLLK